MLKTERNLVVDR